MVTNPEQARTVGMIGVGLLGSSLARLLHDRGWSVLGYDPRPSSDLAAECGSFQWAASAQEVVADCQQIVLSLPTSAIAREVLSQNESALAAGKVFVDTTTGSPNDAVEIAERLSALGVHYLDATVAGSSVLARRGEALMFVGGDPTIFAESQALFDSLSSSVYHVGNNGYGARMKLVHNLILGLNRAVLAEGLGLAQGLELDLEQTLEILKQSPAASAVMDTKGPKMVHGDFEPQARLRQHLKDVRIMLDQESLTAQGLPLSRLHAQLLERLEDEGYGELDNSAIFKAFQ